MEGTELAASAIFEVAQSASVKKVKISLRDERKVFLSRDFIVIADRNNGEFEFKIRGTDLNFKARDTWQELEDDVFDRN